MPNAPSSGVTVLRKKISSETPSRISGIATGVKHHEGQQLRPVAVHRDAGHGAEHRGDRRRGDRRSRSELSAACSMSSSANSLPVPAGGEAHPFGVQLRIVEREDDDDRQRDVEERVDQQARVPEPEARQLAARTERAQQRGCRDQRKSGAGQRAFRPARKLQNSTAMPAPRRRVRAYASRASCLFTARARASPHRPRPPAPPASASATASSRRASRACRGRTP